MAKLIGQENRNSDTYSQLFWFFGSFFEDGTKIPSEISLTLKSAIAKNWILVQHSELAKV